MISKKGFTLVELLVVVAILGVLAAIGIISYSNYISKARETSEKSMFEQVVKYIQVELHKCEAGLEIEAVTKWSYPIGCTTWYDRTYEEVYRNDANWVRFESVTQAIINNLQYYGGPEYGFNNPYGNDGATSGVLSNRDCPTVEQKGFIHCGSGYDRDTNTGYVKCCSRINDTINEKYIYQGSVDDFLK